MALVPVFKALVDAEGKLILRETERPARQRWLQSIAGSNVEVIIRKVPMQRTLDQNNYLHAVPFAMLAKYTGHTIDEIKQLCLAAKFGTASYDERGWPVPVIQHTSSLDKEQGSELIEFLPAWAHDEFRGDVDIPLPGEVEFR